MTVKWIRTLFDLYRKLVIVIHYINLLLSRSFKPTT